MDIECKLQRVGGTHVEIGVKKYHFAPREDGAHVADVEDESHQDRFLSIPEAYRMYRGEAAAAPVIESQKPKVTDQGEAAKNTGGTPAPADILLGSDAHPSSFDIHGKTYSLGDVVALANTASGLDATEWNSLSADTRAGMIDDELDKLEEAGPASQETKPFIGEAQLRAQLVEQFEAKFGKKPHHNASVETIRAKLAEA